LLGSGSQRLPNNSFPFLAQVLFTGESNGTNYVQYNQTLILNSNMEIDQTLLDTVGPPHLTATYIGCEYDLDHRSIHRLNLKQI
jgi:hypothetical protein